MSRTCVVLLLIGGAALAAAQSPQAPTVSHQAPPGARVVTRTRLLALYSEIENNLLTAIQKKDKAAIARTMADDCSIWTPAPPGEPIPRDGWIEQAVASDLLSWDIRQMSAKAVGSVNVVAFVLTEVRRVGGKPRKSALWVVDVWDTTAGEQKLVSRYLSSVPAPAAHAARPTGKE